MQSLYVVNERDNVGTALTALDPGPARCAGGLTGLEIVLAGPIAAGHKAALRAIGPGEAVVKYGAFIGMAARGIAQGEWVHVHNMHSRLDERSALIDAETGQVMDTRYE